MGRPPVNMALRSDHGANILGIFDYLHLTKLLTIRRHPVQIGLATFTAVLHPTAFPMIQVEPSGLVHHFEGRRKGRPDNLV